MRLAIIVSLFVGAAAFASPSAAPPSVPTVAFKTPVLLQRTYPSPKGTLEMLANAKGEGRTLHLSDIAVYPRGTEHIDLGLHELNIIKARLANDARTLGFTRMHITGVRLTGAKPGKKPDLWFDIAPK